MTNEFLAKLRDATRDAHAQLDAMMPVWETTADYARFLVGSLAAIELLEPRLVPAIAPGRVDALRDDLAELGVDPIPGQTFDKLLDDSGVLEAAYVIEGSTLGARVLIQRARPLGPTRYLAVAGRWKDLVGVLARHAPNNSTGTIALDVFAHYASAYRAAGATAP